LRQKRQSWNRRIALLPHFLPTAVCEGKLTCGMPPLSADPASVLPGRQFREGQRVYFRMILKQEHFQSKRR
jgi:hypothetical protein